MKKNLICCVFASFLLASTPFTAFAADTIGYFYEDRAFAASKKIPEIRKEYKEKALQKIASLKKQAEGTRDPKERRQMLQQLELDLRIEEEAAIEPAIKEINLVARRVAISKGVTVLVDSQNVLYGGVDITDDVIKALKAESK